MIGIYKITSPSNRVYIGQSIDIEKRIKSYKEPKGPEKQIRLARSIKKYGWSKHFVEILEECSVENLNERERYWQEFHNVLADGLNCKLTKTNDKTGRMSQDTIDKIKETKRLNPQCAWNKNKKASTEARENMSKSHIGKVHSIERKLKMSLSAKAKTFSDEHKQKLSEASKNKKKPRRKDIIEKKNEIISLYQNKVSITEIHKMFSCTYCLIKRLLVKENVY